MNTVMNAGTALPAQEIVVGKKRRCGERRKRAGQGYIYLSMVGWYCRRQKPRRKDDHLS